MRLEFDDDSSTDLHVIDVKRALKAKASKVLRKKDPLKIDLDAATGKRSQAMTDRREEAIATLVVRMIDLDVAMVIDQPAVRTTDLDEVMAIDQLADRMTDPDAAMVIDQLAAGAAFVVVAADVPAAAMVAEIDHLDDQETNSSN